MKVNKTQHTNIGGRRPFRRFLLVVLLFACLAGAGYLGYMGLAELRERQRGEDFYANLAASVGNGASNYTEARETYAVLPSDEQKAAPGPVTPDESGVTSETAQPVSGQLAQEQSVNQSEIDFQTLWKTCPDVVGWLRIEDSSIDYPIVLGEDNDFYLHHLPDGTENKAGSIMMDEANTGFFQETVNILHGHHMRNGSMFGSLDDYNDEEYYRTHSTIRLYTPAGDYYVAVFAAYTVNGYTFGYPTSFDDEAAFYQFIRKAVSATPYETGVEVAYGDRILMLSTCAYSYTGARYVVMGKIMESEASVSADKINVSQKNQ